MRPHHEGSVFQRQKGRGAGRWVAVVTLANGRRRSKTAETRERAEELLAALRQESPPHHLQITGSRLSFAALIEHHLAWVAEEGWSRRQAARVMSTSLSYARIKFGIWGPCVYCGTPLADTVDHVLPRSKGGTDDPMNLVSACWECNREKRAMPVGKFLERRNRRRGGGPIAVHAVPDDASEVA